MHLLVTDRLSCPRCGPTFGLILLADDLRDRRVLEGALGCANCRERYPVRGGFGDLRPPPRVALEEAAESREARSPHAAEAASEPGTQGIHPGPPADDPGSKGAHPEASADDPAEAALRLAALIGVQEGPGLILLAGGWARLAGRLAARIDEIEVVALDSSLHAEPEEAGVSRLTAGDHLPFFSNALRGVALEGEQLERWGGEAVRVLAPGARLVVRDPPAGLTARLEAKGLHPLLETRRYVVAQRG